MSLINQMLKDLEKNTLSSQHSEAVMSGLKSSVGVFNSKKKSFSFIWIALLFICCIFLIIHFIPFKFQKIDAAPQFKTKINLHLTPAGTLSKAINVENNTLASQKTLTGITLQVQNEKTQVRFLLDKEPLYRINTNDEKNELSITFEDTNALTALPQINYQDSALQNIHMENRKGSLTLTISLLPNSSVENISFVDNKKFPEMEINFLMDKTNPGTATTSMTTNNGYIKKIMVDLPAERYYQKVLFLISMHQNQKAIQELTELLRNTPNFSSARQTLVELLIQERSETKAQEILKQGLQLEPHYIPFLQLKAHILAKKGDLNHAIRLLEQEAPPINQFPEYYSLLAALYQQSGKANLASDLYQQLLHLDPDKSIWWIGLGIALDSIGDHSGAIEAYNHARRDDTLNPRLKDFLKNNISA